MNSFSPINIKERQTLDVRSGDTVRVTQKIIEKDKKTGIYLIFMTTLPRG